MININQFVSLTKINKYLGGYDGSHFDEILEFDPLTGQWKELAQMKEARSRHGMSVIDYSEVEQFCNDNEQTLILFE